MIADRAGYSLMEAIVALFILAIVAVGLTRATQSHIDGVRGLEQRAVAQWVAQNRLIELGLAGGGRPGGAPSTVRMMDRDWAVQSRSRATDDPDLLAIDVVVSEAGRTGPAVQLSGFVDRMAGG